MNTLFIDNAGQVSYAKIFTGLGPVHGITYWEDAIAQAILNGPNAEIMVQSFEDLGRGN